MNSLFTITKDNVNNFFIEYSKNKQNKLNNETKTKSKSKTKTKTKTKPKPKSNKIIKESKNDLNLNISKYLEPNNFIIEQIYNQNKLDPKNQPIKPNFNYEKKQNNQQNPIINELNFNYEIKKIKPDILDAKITNKIINYNKKESNDKQYVKDIKDKSNNIILDKKSILFEYGKSGIKIDRLKKSMRYNLNVLSLIDNMIKSFLDINPKLKLNTILFDNKNNLDTEKKIHFNNVGQISIEKNMFFNVNIFDKKNNKYDNCKKYNLIDFGYIKIYDIKFTEEFINKHKIPSLNSIITFSENIKHFLKLIKLFEHTDKYKIKINQFGNSNLDEIILQHLPSIILNINEKKNLFNSSDNKFTFYIKTTELNTTAFIIDKEEKILCYLNSVDKNLSGYIFFYIIALDSKYKIINLNKLNSTEKDKIKIKKDNIKIKKVNVEKAKSSEISDFSDSNDFIEPKLFT